MKIASLTVDTFLSLNTIVQASAAATNQVVKDEVCLPPFPFVEGASSYFVLTMVVDADCH